MSYKKKPTGGELTDKHSIPLSVPPPTKALLVEAVSMPADS